MRSAETRNRPTEPWILVSAVRVVRLASRKPPAGQLVYERRNGKFVLQITGHPEFGVPYGQDRIVPIFLASLAVRQKRQTIRFKTAAEMLETFGRHKGGKEYWRLVAAFERIFGATMFFGTDLTTSKAQVIQRSRFNFLREAQIWYDRRSDQRVLREDFENVIVLSDEFYQEIMAHPIPTDLEAVKVLACAPAVLDLFMWLSYRCFLARGRESIPIFGPFGLVSQLGSVEYSRPRRFRAMLSQWLGIIRAMWPGCPARISSDSRSLIIERAAAILPQAGKNAVGYSPEHGRKGLERCHPVAPRDAVAAPGVVLSPGIASLDME